VTGAWALVPARSFRTAKSRLGGRARAAVARALYDRVVGVLAQSRLVDGVVVATDGGDVAAAARLHKADHLIDDPRGAPLASIVDRGLAHLAARGARAAVVVMADLPLLGPRHVEDLLAALDGADLALAPDRDQAGTNALALRLPAALRTCFGNADSLARHLAAADAHGLTVRLVRAHGLAFDVDHPADLAELVDGAPPAEAEPRVPRQLAVGSERLRRVGDTVERIAAIVADTGAARPVHAEDPVERVPLGGRPPGSSRDRS
jgi:2-phospho-L-lactate guanylyltransferase